MQLNKVGNFLNRISNIFDSDDPIIILPYRGYANETRIYLKSRVLESEDIFIGKTESKIQNIINSVKRFETDIEIYFTLDSEWTAPPKEKENDWLTARIKLIGFTNDENQATITTTTEIYIPSKNTDYGIIKATWFSSGIYNY